MNNVNFMQPLTNFQQFHNFSLNPKMNLESLILNWPSPPNVNTAKATPGIQFLLTIKNNCCLACWGLDF